MAYYTLISSLPHLPAHFDVERPPISRPRLNERLQLLTESDAKVLRQQLDFLAWDRQPIDREDQEVVHAYDNLRQSVEHPILMEIVEHRINVRTIVSALRRRRAGQPPPLGVGQLVDPIRRMWKEPQFGLDGRFPWIADFATRMEQGDALAAERVLYEFTWNTWCRMAAEFTFSFEAVMLYLARWSIIDRWTSRDAARGRELFEHLIGEVLGPNARIQF